MAKIKINKEHIVNGKLSISRTLNETKDGFIITGVLATHLYLEDIKSLESSRYIVKDIEVYQESFGSDDYDIYYNFTAGVFKLKDVIKEGIGTILYSDEIEMIETEMYKNNHPILGDIGEQYKDMYIEEEEDNDNK